MTNYNKFWDDMSLIEEDDLDDEKINRLLRWKELKGNLDGVKNILDIGGATGVFSIQLAKMGYQVTHFDISEDMIKKAEIKAKSQGVDNIVFIKGNAKNLDLFTDNQFDLVINFDGAISF